MGTHQEPGQIPPGPDGDPVSVPSEQYTEKVPISSKQDTEPVQNQDAQPVHTSDAEPVQTSDAEPVQILDAEPVQTSDAEPVKNSDAEPVKNLDAEPVQTSDAEPVQNLDAEDAEPVQNQDAEPVQNQDAEQVQNPDAEPVQNQDAEPVQNQDAEPVQNQDDEPVQNPDAEPVQNQDAEPVQNLDAEPVQNLDAEPVQNQDAEPMQNQDTETVPVSSYQGVEQKQNQDTEVMRSQAPEPVADESSKTAIISSYQDAEPIPNSSYQQEEGLPENGLNAEDTQRNKDQAPVTEDHENENSSFQDKNDNTESLAQDKFNFSQLPQISPGSTGQGFPYAPADWPNQGDVWTWRVGKRVNSAGICTDRFLILPQNLQKRGSPNTFASTQSLTRYIRTRFPDADIDAFFASFSWKIPALRQPAAKVDSAAIIEETPRTRQKEAEDNGIVQSATEGNSRYSQRKRKSVQMLGRTPAQEKAKVTPHNTQKGVEDKSVSKPRAEPTSASGQKSLQSAGRSTRQRGGAVDMNSLDAETAASDPRPRKKKNRTVNPEDEQAPIPHIYVSPTNGVLTVSHSPVEVNPEEFDSYLDNIENLLTQAPEEGQAQVSSIDVDHVVASPIVDYDFTEPRMKLSSILEKDFPSLFFSTEATELADLATQIRQDPSLTAEEMVKLKLIEEIPSFSDVFRENKRVIDEADKFFSALDLNKAKVSSLKCEYSELKNNLSSLQMEVESHTESIRQIDEEIAQLRARRVELSSMIGNKNKEKLDLIYAQKMVANSIPRFVQEVQVANSKNPNWEMKKENAIRREKEILTKFAPLKGFRF